VIHNENFKNVSRSRKLESLCLFVYDANDGLCASDTVNLWYRLINRDQEKAKSYYNYGIRIMY
jgi:hypothetical protein